MSAIVGCLALVGLARVLRLAWRAYQQARALLSRLARAASAAVKPRARGLDPDTLAQIVAAVRAAEKGGA